MTRDDVLSNLPAPFAWCSIPTGEVMIDGQVFTVQPLYIAQYPITVEQFQVFVDDTQGYKYPAWWEDMAAYESGQRWLAAQRFTHALNLPRDNVSWYDAVAFCRWLSEKTNTEIRLPTEWEWQWAAQGEDDRLYAWGNAFDRNLCNARDSGIDQTTPVDRYPAGASPFGVVDMCGNVWEWCLNEFHNPVQTGLAGDAMRVMRGGAWGNHASNVKVTERGGLHPGERSAYYGFRIVLIP